MADIIDIGKMTKDELASEIGVSARTLNAWITRDPEGVPGLERSRLDKWRRYATKKTMESQAKQTTTRL
jgi:hypothetical protein